MTRFLSLTVLLGASVAAAWLLGLFESAAPPREEGGIASGDLDASAPALTSKGRAPVARVGLDGAALYEELAALGEAARTARLKALDPKGAAPSYDKRLVALLVQRVIEGGRAERYQAQRILVRMGPAAQREVAALWSHADRNVRQQGVSIFAGWARARQPFEDPGWVTMLADQDKQLADYTWRVICNGVPYSESLAEECVRRMRAGFMPEHERGIQTTAVGTYVSGERALARMGPQGLELLFGMLEGDEEGLLLSALGGIKHARPEELRAFWPRLEPWIRAEHEERQVLALGALHAYEGDTEALMPALLAAYEHESFAVRYEVLALLERMGLRAGASAEAMIAAMDDGDERISTRAMNILAVTRAQPAVVLPKLRAALDEGADDPAAIAMGQYGAAAEPYLRSALQSNDDDVRYFALAGVYRMGPASARLRDLVIPLITIDDDDMAHRASMATGPMGAEAAEALPLMWERYILGKLHAQRLAETYLRIGAVAERFLLERLRDPKSHALALAALVEYPTGTAFAFDAVAPLLASKDEASRHKALMIVQHAIHPPLPAPGTHARHFEGYVAPRAIRTRVRELLGPLVNHPHENTQHHAKQTLEWIAAMDKREAEGPRR